MASGPTGVNQVFGNFKDVVSFSVTATGSFQRGLEGGGLSGKSNNKFQ
jgi:hypothetical protein